MDEQRQDVQLEPTHSMFVPIRDVALKTCRKLWTIGSGGEKRSGVSVLLLLLLLLIIMPKVNVIREWKSNLLKNRCLAVSHHAPADP